MATSAPGSISALLARWEGGDKSALDEIIPLIEPELRRIARRVLSGERRGASLETAMLVAEAYIRLKAYDPSLRPGGRQQAQFQRLVVRVMRRFLVDRARRNKAEIHGGKALRVSLDLAFNRPGQQGLDAEFVVALNQALEKLEPDHLDEATVVELHCFGGLTVEETAKTLDISRSTVTRRLEQARLLLSELWTGGKPA